MPEYNAGFARVYNQRWDGFATQAAPLIRAYYEGLEPGRSTRTLLDLCCGTGQLAAHFLAHGYRVTGLDISPHMLTFAREHNAQAIAAGRAEFLQGDAVDFRLDRRFGLVVSTYDALNHLPDMTALESCFTCVYAVLEPAGCFIFDLNTANGLRRWNNIFVDDGDRDYFTVSRGFYDGEAKKAHTRISGFYRTENQLYERFEITAYNTVFAMAAVQEALHMAGWPRVHFARLSDLAMPLDDPETESRVFIVARKD